MPTYAIADLHGRFDLFTMAIATITERGGGTVVFTGDYIDRGPESRQIIDALMQGPPAGQEWIALKGNHEDMMVSVCRGRASVQWWMENGGAQTLLSYGHPMAGNVEVSIVPQMHLDWLDCLPIVLRDGRRLFVHAGVDPLVALDLQSEQKCLWMLYPDGFVGGHGDLHVVHGHHQFAEGPKLYAGRTNLDTFAWYTGRLVVGVFDDDMPGGPVELIEIIGEPHELALREDSEA
ncbi:metallophosphoesterase [Methylobacterium durans]|uniref:Serine/threonine protein phosphatase n=1 Tax=Methylobacterium durans TaxID=2202825 RepID=A0A2U8W9F4_9HYPH|nr:metallophosphoesterase [Methylobacterium durans]AWN42765.1 serine/threonine protein phosphatase [Methylobacterium durans]